MKNTAVLILHHRACAGEGRGVETLCLQLSGGQKPHKHNECITLQSLLIIRMFTPEMFRA